MWPPSPITTQRWWDLLSHFLQVTWPQVPQTQQEVLLVLCTHQAPIFRGQAQPTFVLWSPCLIV